VKHLVLDEADRLFELGFLTQTDEIIAACTDTQMRKAMFSATIPSGVEELAKSVMGSDMIRVIIGGSDSATRTIKQDLTFTGNEDGKLVALKNLIKSGGLTPPALIFVQSVERAQDLNRELAAYNVKSEAMHAERSKEDRDKIVQRFAEGKIWVLVCTDVMSRGVDFRGVELVVK
jgi:ATP-dependent RNA helicase DDX52/ROK1